MTISDEYLKKFPRLAYPLCWKEGKYGGYTCGYCSTARAIARNGSHMRFSLNGQTAMPREDAIAYNLGICEQRRSVTSAREDRTVVGEIRRDGQRILKAGANVYVQLKAKKGTAKSAGVVVECYENNLVKIHVTDLGMTKTVPADEFVTGRSGTTTLAGQA